MKRFLLRVTAFGTLLILSFLCLAFFADGYTDPFYLKYTGKKQQNLILGTSRAAQGLQPRILNKALKKDFFNYAFTIGHSPYGPVYLNSVRKKLDTTIRDGIFILTVDPWSIASEGEDPNDTLAFRENNRSLAMMKEVNSYPNFEYLYKVFEGRYYKLIPFPASLQYEYLHRDGWLEVKLDVDSTRFEKRSEERAASYKRDKMEQTLSSLRVSYLERTISYLQRFGKVYLVRLPVHESMEAIEKEFMPDFNSKIMKAVSMSDGYLDLNARNHEFLYVDGNHLHRESGKIVSGIVADYIEGRSIQAQNSILDENE